MPLTELAERLHDVERAVALSIYRTDAMKETVDNAVRVFNTERDAHSKEVSDLLDAFQSGSKEKLSMTREARGVFRALGELPTLTAVVLILSFPTTAAVAALPVSVVLGVLAWTKGDELFSLLLKVTLE
jgi:hypothetical protein